MKAISAKEELERIEAFRDEPMERHSIRVLEGAIADTSGCDGAHLSMRNDAGRAVLSAIRYRDAKIAALKDALLCAEERAQRAEREMNYYMERADKAEASLAAQVEMSARLAGNLRGYVEALLSGPPAESRHVRAKDALAAYDKALSSPGKEEL